MHDFIKIDGLGKRDLKQIYNIYQIKFNMQKVKKKVRKQINLYNHTYSHILSFSEISISNHTGQFINYNECIRTYNEYLHLKLNQT